MKLERTLGINSFLPNKLYNLAELLYKYFRLYKSCTNTFDSPCFFFVS